MLYCAVLLNVDTCLHAQMNSLQLVPADWVKKKTDGLWLYAQMNSLQLVPADWVKKKTGGLWLLLSDSSCTSPVLFAQLHLQQRLSLHVVHSSLKP